MTDQSQPQSQPLQAVPTPQPDEIDQLEAQVRQRVDALGKQIEAARAEKKAISARIQDLLALQKKAQAMLPRTSRPRKPKVSPPTA